VKSYVFRVVVEYDEMETGEKAYHACRRALKGLAGDQIRLISLAKNGSRGTRADQGVRPTVYADCDGRSPKSSTRTCAANTPKSE